MFMMLLELRCKRLAIIIDFSKAFHSVRHSTLLHKMAQLDIPDEVYNWLVSFFRGHSHCTLYQGIESSVLEITASIIQGSAIGPASYVVGAADLRAVTPGNELVKFADDTYTSSSLPQTTAADRLSSTMSLNGLGRIISRPIRPNLQRSSSSTVVRRTRRMATANKTCVSGKN